MLKKSLTILALILTYTVSTHAQSVHVELNYQSFRPFVHFQLDFGSHSHHRSYRSAYLKGYMDGVNDAYYYNHRFSDLVHDARIYESGYRDGLRDRTLLIRLRGHNWYNRHRFGYDDYYAPSYSVRIWLSGLSLAFLRAPERRLPRHWKRQTHPRFKKYRKWYKKRRHHDRYDDDDNYRRFAKIEKQYNKRIERYKRKAHKVKRRHRKKPSYDRNKRSDKRFKFNSKRRGKSSDNHRAKRSKRRRSVEKDDRRRGRSRSVDKRSNSRRQRGEVKKSRGHQKNRGRSGRSRSRGRDNR